MILHEFYLLVSDLPEIYPDFSNGNTNPVFPS